MKRADWYMFIICILIIIPNFLEQEIHSSDFSVLGADGLIIEIESSNFIKVMRKMDYAIVFIYNPKICKMGIECKEIIEEFKKASEKLYKNSPAVGLFKIRCNFGQIQKENKNICEKLDIQEENIPQLMFVYFGNYIFLDKSKPIFANDILKTMQNKIFLTSITSLDNKRSVKQFFNVENKIDEEMNFHSMKFVIYSNKINEEIEINNNKTIDYLKIPRDCSKLENLFYNSDIFTSFKAYKIVNLRALLYFLDYTKNNSHYIIENNIEKILIDPEEYFKIEENLIITFHVPENILNEENREKDKELRKMNVFNFKFKNYDSKNEKSVEENKKILNNLVIFNSFPNLVNYLTDSEIIKILRYSDKSGYFFYVHQKKNLKIFDEYNFIAKKFEYLKEKYWFLYSNEGENYEQKKEKSKESHNVKLFYYDNFDLIGKPTYFFLDEDINYNYVKSFLERKSNFENLTKIIDSKNKLLDIFEYRNDIVFTKNFVIFFYNIVQTDEHKSIFKKWSYLLEKTNYLINSDEYTKIQFFKYDYKNNKEVMNFPVDIIKEKSNKIYLFTKKSYKNEINFEFKKYEKGPSLQFFENFLQENLPLIKIKFDSEEYQKYFEELFYNNELMELESELDDLDEEFELDSTELINDKNIKDKVQILNNKKEDL